MKILYLAHRVPYPPNKGDKIRSFYEIRHFSRRHDVHLLAFCDQPGDEVYAKELKEYCRQVTLVPLRRWPQRFRAAATMVFGKPWTLGYFAHPAMQEALAGQMRENSFDLIFAFSSSMAPYAKSLNGLPRILDFVDSDASKWRQYSNMRSAPSKWLYAFEWRNLKQYEEDAISDFNYSIFVSRRELEHLPKCVNSAKVCFIQNGVDFDYFSAVTPGENRKSIIFTGAMDYFPNIGAVDFFAREVLPIIRAKIPDAQFLIVGSNPSRQVRALADLPGVTVTGTVKDVRPYLADAGVAVVPIKVSQGIQNKILEALASSLPVVATKVALGGIPTTKDLPIAEADDAQSFAEHVIGFLKNPLTQTQIEKCRRVLQTNFDWDANLSIFDRLFERLVPSHSVFL
jgi:sugar transferase (PEP-CTERM/EpsH1 system associated)